MTDLLDPPSYIHIFFQLLSFSQLTLQCLGNRLLAWEITLTILRMTGS